MGYYDNVKNDVKENDDTSKPNFDTLRKAAEETDTDEDREGDDTDIEILEEGLDRGSSGGSSSSGIKELGGDDKQSSSSSGSKNQKNTGSSGSSASGASADISGVEDKLDKIIEQNERMIDILESFGS